MQSTGRLVLLLCALVPALILLPIVLWKLHLPFISSTSGPEYRVFEIFAFCVSLTAILGAAFRLKRPVTNERDHNFPIILFTLLACYFAAQITEYRPLSSDWLSYQHAAQAILAGSNPYVDTGYLYPPLTASALATVFKAVVWASGLAGIPVDSGFAWQGVFYLYQCCQFFLVMGAAALCFRLGKMLGADGTTTATLVAVLFVFNAPLLRTIHFHQVNVWVFDLMMVAALFPHRSIMVGIALAVAIHLKLYAAVLLLPFLLLKRYAPVLWALIGIAVIVAVQTNWGTNTSVWQQYVAFVQVFPAGTTFRDNSLHSVVYNTLALATRMLALESDTFNFLVAGLTALATAGAVVYFIQRYRQREQTFRDAIREDTEAGSSIEWKRTWRGLGHTLDAIALALLISPLVWEHHYILALPLIIYAALTQERSAWPRVGIAAFLMLAIPIFDVFPFSYHRAAGLLLLLHTTSPRYYSSLQRNERWKMFSES